ncbi:MAG: D-2-hydroxyacid dehydrogenase [Candidatus Poribacteria bacterium]|nr:D-2-hydroxyacid dehydrogenase [Candidatus Poribacteria bacterium]MDE0468826.1 D-2-hydroxyacid dehydrogenase [Candidatus Poribacteria bacterium]
MKVLIGSRQAPEIEGMLSDVPPDVEVRFLPQGESLREHIADVDILFGHLGEDAIPEATALRWVHQPHAGVEGFMYPAFKASEIILTNCRGLYGTQIAEHAFALLLSITRRIPDQLEFMKTKHWERVPCVELAGMTMGILGLGGIGRAIATRAQAFEFNIIAADIEPIDKPDTVSELFGLDELMAFLAKSNILMVCCPSTPETHKLLSDAQFNQMPDDSYVVNVSRGKVVDEEALVAALRNGKVAGAGLDVTYTEPCPPENPLWEQENVILTSHSAGSSQHIRRRAMQLFIDNLHRYVEGKPLVNVVDKQKGY